MKPFNAVSLFPILIALVSESADGQNMFDSHIAFQRCITMKVDSIRRAKHPELGSLTEFENGMQQKILEYKRAANDERINESYTIPVIIHVIYNGESLGNGRNISDEQIQSQIDVLNEDYSKRNSNISMLDNAPYNSSNWKSLAASCDFTFCLAKKDTSGKKMTSFGIDRIDRSSRGIKAPPYDQTYIDESIKPLTIWDPNEYLNIWVLDISGEILGYATFPPNSKLTGLNNASWGTLKDDGVVIGYQYFGRTGNVKAPYNLGRTATHEIGHWLGLRHIWGEDSYCGSDYCNDTPTQFKSNAGSPNFPHISCSNSPNGDMFINYMDYTNDTVMCMFTNDQKSRMQVVMSNADFRANLSMRADICMDELALDDTGDQFVFPNPSSGEININANATIKSMTIYNILGQIVSCSILNINDRSATVNMEINSNGMYFLKIETDSEINEEKVLLVK